MTLEELQALLDSGAITQEQFDKLAESIKAADPQPTDPDPKDPDPDPTPDDDFDKKFQKKFDRAMAQERKEKAELKKKLEKLQNKMLTDDEKKQQEFDEKQREIDEQRKELALERNKMYAIKAMQKSNISNTEETMQLIEKLVVSCEDETDIDDIIDLLKTWHEKTVKAEVEKRFKDNGYNPQKSGTLNGGRNPYKAEQFSLTEQMQLELENPELAKQLQAEAGVK